MCLCACVFIGAILCNFRNHVHSINCYVFVKMDGMVASHYLQPHIRFSRPSTDFSLHMAIRYSLYSVQFGTVTTATLVHLFIELLIS